MFKLPKFTVGWKELFGKKPMFLVGQVGAVAAIAAGVAHWSHAAAWVLVGLVTLVAIERNS